MKENKSGGTMQRIASFNPSDLRSIASIDAICMGIKMDSFRNLSIGKKFAFSLGFGLFAPLLILFVYINTNFTEKIMEQECINSLESLQKAAIPIEYLIDDIYYMGTEVLGDEEIQMYLSGYGQMLIDEKLQYQYRINYNLTRLLNAHKYASRLVLFKDDQMLIQSGSYRLSETFTAADIQHQKGEQNAVWQPAVYNEYFAENDSGYEIEFIKELKSLQRYNEQIGYVKVFIPEEYLSDIYNSAGSDGITNMLLVDSSGNVMSSLDKTILEQNIADEEYVKEVSLNDSGYFFNGKELITYLSISRINWKLIKIETIESVKYTTDIFRTVLLFPIILTSIFAVFFIYVQRKYIIRPVIELSGYVQSFKEHIHPIEIKHPARDEIGMLNKSFADMSIYIDTLVKRIYKSQLEERNMELKYLQAQINPHFLYNTLDTIRFLALEAGNHEVAEQTEALSNVFKHALNLGKELTTVKQELENLQSYITIQSKRFGDRIQFILDTDESLSYKRVLNLILQPLVENAIIHGMENQEEGEIRISVTSDNQDIIYVVEDNGQGTDELAIQVKLEDDSESINVFALDNINKRLKFKYGEKYHLDFRSEPGRGTRVTVRMPTDQFE